MAARSSVLVPRSAAVCGMNWMRPTAPDPAAFFTDGLKVSPLSKAMHDISQSGSMPIWAAMEKALARNSGLTFAPQAMGFIVTPFKVGVRMWGSGNYGCDQHVSRIRALLPCHDGSDRQGSDLYIFSNGILRQVPYALQERP